MSNNNLDYAVEQQEGGTEISLVDLELFCDRLRSAGAPDGAQISTTDGDYFRLVGVWSA